MTTAWNTGTVPEFGLSDRLRKAREHVGMSIEDFAKHIGKSRNTISNYESAEYSAAIDALEACDTFGDAQGCDDAIRDLEALHDPILATHGTQAATQVALVESKIAEWDANGCATKNHCTLQWSMTATEAKQLRLDMKQY